MKWKRKLLTGILASVLGAAFVLPALAAEEPVIDMNRTGSLTIYKYDMTRAFEDGLAGGLPGNGSEDAGIESSYRDYAVAGVEFSYLKIADLETETHADPSSGTIWTGLLYGLDEKTAEVFQSAGVLQASDNRYVKKGKSYAASDALTEGLTEALKEQAITVRDTLESYIVGNVQRQYGVTDTAGRISASGLLPGLYLVVETSVPEDVISTVDPFLVSLPMTDSDGTGWMYDVTVYPKNQTGMPDLKKEAAQDRGEAKEYRETISASSGDKLAYRITSRLPVVTSQATYLTEYTFEDSLSKGISYRKGELSLSWYGSDQNLKEVWRPGTDSGMFQVSYGKTGNGETMQISLTQAGLAAVNRVFSEGTVVIEYAAELKTDDSVICGDQGNPNEAELTWRRTNKEYSDTLKAECRVFTYGLEIEKRFQSGNKDFGAVNFQLKNETEDCYVTAKKAEDGCYYVTGLSPAAGQGTSLSPDAEGNLKVLGLEEDAYLLTETATAEGYLLLKDAIRLSIVSEEKGGERIGKAAVNGEAVTMKEWKESAHALLPLVIVNQKGFPIPLTGDRGIFVLPVIGLAAAGTAVALWLSMKKRKHPGKNE
jgi:fimbrial isopeptide formation D2 family protein/LPXTG-motif cell wall-anchored protein